LQAAVKKYLLPTPFSTSYDLEQNPIQLECELNIARLLANEDEELIPQIESYWLTCTHSAIRIYSGRMDAEDRMEFPYMQIPLSALHSIVEDCNLDAFGLEEVMDPEVLQFPLYFKLKNDFLLAFLKESYDDG